MAQKTTSSIVVVGDLRMHILRSYPGGSDPPLVILLHGFLDLSYSWRKLIPSLAEAGYYAVAPDQRGYGLTTTANSDLPVHYDDDISPYRMLNPVKDIVTLVYTLGYSSAAAVVGHDFGAVVAAYCALIRPDIFKSLVLMSHPFAGAPGLSLNLDKDLDNQDRELAALNPPRKNYTKYYTTRSANNDMLNAPSGLHSFFCAYYHAKSADSSHGTAPHPLPSSSACSLALMPYYYIMPLHATMPESVAPSPTARTISIDRWLPDPILAIYVSTFAKTGFQGGLNWYRCMRDHQFVSELSVFAEKKIEVPAMFIAGKMDWGVWKIPGDAKAMRDRDRGICARMEEKDFVLVEGAGHWVQQERPDAVLQNLMRFLKRNESRETCDEERDRHARTMSTNIPYDIWYHISRFIPTDELRELYRVNRTFFEIAMDERYREVTFVGMLDAKSLRRITRRREPYISSRVKSLVIHNFVIAEDEPFLIAELLDVLARLVNVRKVYWKLYNDPTLLANSLMQAISSLPFLTELAITIYTPGFPPPQWHRFKNLRRLTVTCLWGSNIEGLVPGIVQASPDLRQLRIIPIEKGLHGFLPSVSDNSPLMLQELWLEGIIPHLDSSTILCLPSLKSLIWRSLRGDDLFRTSGVWQAFRSAGISLSHLKTDMINDDMLEYLSSFQGLRELELQILQETSLNDELARRFFRETLPRHSHTLESLSIQPNNECAWCVAQDNIFAVGSCRNLRKVQLSVCWPRSDVEIAPYDDQNLDGPVFLVLDYTRQLPYLQSLEISPIRWPSPLRVATHGPPPYVFFDHIRDCISTSIRRFEAPGVTDMVTW